LAKRFSNSTWALVLVMTLAVAAVSALAHWDEERESAAALDDFGQENATIAASVANELATRLQEVRRDAARVAGGSAEAQAPGLASYLESEVVADGAAAVPEYSRRGVRLEVPVGKGRAVRFLVAPSELLGGAARLERPNALAVFVSPPGESLRATDGREVRSPALEAALASGRATVRLPGAAAAPLGLPERTAMAGLARVSAGPLGTWGVAAVASAERERDRERRARLRLVLAVILAAGLVLGFGGLAIRKQRGELLLERELAVAEIARERDDRLARLSRAATMVTMASGLAHEISTPLGVIAGRAEQLLQRAGPDERARRSLQAVLEQSERIRDVIRGFLDLARGGTPSLAAVAPGAVVDGARALVEHRFEKAGVGLVVRVPEGLPPLWCDQRLLEHALVNLLLNSCDASPRGAGVDLSAELHAGSICFVVEDHGAGIPEANAALAVQPFFTTKPRGSGTGLGLAIVSEIAKSHRGTLSLAPGQPHGTRACVEIPLVQGEAAPGEVQDG
jgi:signal transduction histidine kinase